MYDVYLDAKMVFNTVLERITSNYKVDKMEGTDRVVVQRVPYGILFLGEFLGTAILMYIGCMGCVLDFPGGPILPAFAFGFAILASVQIVGHITGCHMNPAISLGLLILGKMDWRDFLVYLPGQYLGAMAGYAALKVMMPDGYAICVLTLGNGVDFIQVHSDLVFCFLFYCNFVSGFFIEFCVTAILMLVVAGSNDDKNKNKVDSAPLRIGLTVSGFVFAAAPFTSAALNPARSLPPSLLNNHWDYHWIFHLGPFLGAFTAAVMYRFIFEETENYSLYKLTLHTK
ncbi:hypothetical protein NQ317_004688 [Molorchus minor]|uniref:Aquaporin n=1 Tax=Molorchus minor TaxID=1323400 RepID=A0ABQ9JF05_9CUCU|nr:hypothetical protein NQ317_004688 [Molorchus minor]